LDTLFNDSLIKTNALFLNESAIQLKLNDLLINSDLLPPIGGFNFTFKVSFHFFKIISNHF